MAPICCYRLGGPFCDWLVCILVLFSQINPEMVSFRQLVEAPNIFLAKVWMSRLSSCEKDGWFH